MKTRSWLGGPKWSASLLVVFMALACTGPPDEAPREQPAPDFTVITDAQLGSAMWQLAAGIKAIDAIFAGTGSITESERQKVIAVLERMITAADGLGPNGLSSDHPRIAHNLVSFQDKLKVARSSVAMQPPRYYLVGSLSGTCLACHAPQ